MNYFIKEKAKNVGFVFVVFISYFIANFFWMTITKMLVVIFYGQDMNYLIVYIPISLLICISIPFILKNHKIEKIKDMGHCIVVSWIAPFYFIWVFVMLFRKKYGYR